MSYALELAMMMETMAQLSSNPKMRAICVARRDELLKDVPSELEHQRRMSQWLFSKCETKIYGTPIEIPLSYGRNDKS